MLLLIWGCSQDDSPSLTNALVVDGLIYFGQPVKINLSLLAPLNSGAPIPYDLAPLVAIRSQDQDFPLWSVPGQAGTYQDLNNQIPLVPGGGIILFVLFQDTVVAAATTMPFAPSGMRLDRDIIPINAPDLEAGGADSLRWLNTENQLYTAKLTLVDQNPVKINSNEADPPTEFVLGAIDGNTYAIPHNALRYYGVYRLVLYASTSDYGQFFASNGQSQVQQHTNVSNGLGIFAALNSDTLFFSVIPK